MANRRQLELIRRDVEEWNEWRQASPATVPDLSHAELNDADLTGANLARVLLTGAELLMASLVGAVLAGADLSMANLSGADLRDADLSNAKVDGTRMLGVDLAGANLCATDLSTADGLTQEQINQTRGDEQTVLPEGVEYPTQWPRQTQRERGQAGAA